MSEKNSWQIDMQNYDSSNTSLLGQFQNRTCKGICRNFVASKPPGQRDRYANGQVRCTGCMVFLSQKGVVTSESGKWLCKCCHMPVRTRPRHGDRKRVYLEKTQNQAPNNLETIDSVDEDDIETVEEYTKKSTPVFQESTNQKTYYDLRNFIENEIQLQANYQLVMLKILVSNKDADKGEIAESLAYFNNKDNSNLDEVKKYLRVPVYDVLVKRGFVKENRKPNGRKIYELNVNLTQYQQIELNEILEKKIEKWNNEHAIPENQFDSNGIDWFEHGDLLVEPNVWIWPVTEENWKIVQQKNIWGSKVPVKQIQNKLLKDDMIIFYIIGTKEFRGIYRISGRWYDSTDKVWADELRSNEIIYNSRVNLEPVKLGTAKIENLKDLLIFEGKDQNLLNLTLKGIAGYPANNAKPIPSTKKNNLIVLCDTNFSAYNNQLDADFGILFFSGEGQSGDQDLSGGNFRLANSNNISIFYFVEVQQEPGMKKRGALDNIYKLIGKVSYLKHTIKIENDISGKPRQVIKFLLEIEK
jgi:predicted RNA-binding protein